MYAESASDSALNWLIYKISVELHVNKWTIIPETNNRLNGMPY